MFCPLVGPKLVDQAHLHDACACLDRHSWVVEQGQPVCLYCGTTRCPQHRAAGATTTRCTRRDGHGTQHLFARG